MMSAVTSMRLLKRISEMDKSALKRIARLGLPCLLIAILAMSVANFSIDYSSNSIPEVEVEKKDLTPPEEDLSVEQSEDLEKGDIPSTDIDWKDGFPIVHSFVLYQLSKSMEMGSAVVAIHVFCTFVTLVLIRKVTLRIWTLQEIANINLKVDLDELQEEAEEIIENLDEMISSVGEKIETGKEKISTLKQATEDPSILKDELQSKTEEEKEREEKQQIAKKRMKEEPSTMAQLFSTTAMFSYFFFMIQVDSSELPSGIAMAQMFTLLAILLSTSRLVGKKPHSYLIIPAIILAALSSPIGPLVILPVLLFLIIGELSADNDESSLMKKLAIAFLVAIIGGLATSLLVNNLLSDFNSAFGTMLGGMAQSLLVFTPLLAMLSLIPFDRLREPVERSFVIYGGSIFALTFFIPEQLISQLHYALLIPGSILAAFAVTSLIEDFTTELFEKVAIHSVKFFATLGALPIVSMAVQAAQQANADDTGFMSAIKDEMSTRNLLFIGIGLIGLFFLIMAMRRDKKEEMIENQS